MRLNKYLEEKKEYSEPPRTKKIERTAAIGFLERNGIQAKDIGQIYRGLPGKFDYGFVQPSQYVRQSRNTENYYTLMIDNFPSWKKYPKRSRSLICSSDVYYASGFGNLYQVFPEKNGLIGVCSEMDIWSSFPMLGDHDLDAFNTFLKEMFQEAMIISKGLEAKLVGRLSGLMEIKVPTYNDLLRYFKVCDSVDRKVLKRSLPDSTELFWSKKIDYLDKHDVPLLKVLEDALDPDRNDFELIRYGQKPIPKKDREVWTDSNCLLIDDELVGNIFKGE